MNNPFRKDMSEADALCVFYETRDKLNTPEEKAELMDALKQYYADSSMYAKDRNLIN